MAAYPRGIVDVAGVLDHSPETARRRRLLQLFVWFSDHRGIWLIIVFSVAVFVFIPVVIIVWSATSRCL
jgi:hypothetical protein